MRIDLKDDAANYLNWGSLVEKWITGALAPPGNVGELQQQMTAAHVVAHIKGAPTRGVSVVPYNEDDDTSVIEIPIPTLKEFQHRMRQAVAGPYPRRLMPAYVDLAYGGAARVPLSNQEAHDFAIRRIGEYTVNECC